MRDDQWRMMIKLWPSTSESGRSFSPQHHLHHKHRLRILINLLVKRALRIKVPHQPISWKDDHEAVALRICRLKMSRYYHMISLIFPKIYSLRHDLFLSFMINTVESIVIRIKGRKYRIILTFHPLPAEAGVAFENRIPRFIGAFFADKDFKIFHNQFLLEIIR